MRPHGLDAFDEPTRREVERLMKRPINRFGEPIYCRSCTDALGRFNGKCPRKGTATVHLCPFRQAFEDETAEAEA